MERGVIGHYVSYYCAVLEYRSNNFIVGLTNANPVVSRPTLWNYPLCGQYPGAVPASATVSVYCQNNLPPARYLIVQFPITEHMNICELSVLVRGMSIVYQYFAIVCLSQQRRQRCGNPGKPSPRIIILSRIKSECNIDCFPKSDDLTIFLLDK